MKFHRVSMNFIENEHYVDPMTATGKLVHDCISQFVANSCLLTSYLNVKYLGTHVLTKIHSPGRSPNFGVN